MEVVKLGQRQIFGMKKANLMKRINRYFEQTNRVAEVVEYLVAVLLREALCVGDFTPSEELIHQLFLHSEPNDTLRRYSVFFERFFSKDEWRMVVDRLFKNEADYHEYTKETCRYRAFLENNHCENPKSSEYQFYIVSNFKDINGKRHTWILRDTKIIPPEFESETAEILKILTSLTIFQVSGVRRFAEYVDFKGHKNSIYTKHQAVQIELETPVQTTISDNEEESPQEKSALPTSAVQKTAQKQSVPGRNKSEQPPHEEEATKFPLSEEKPSTEVEDSFVGNGAVALEKPPAKNAAATSQQSDTSHMRYGKSKEQVRQDRKDKKWNNKMKRALIRAGWGSKKKK